MSNDEMTGDEKLKKAFAASGGRAASPGGCPDDETIWAASRGELPPDRVQEILAHSLDCTACEESLRMAAGMLAEMHDGVERPSAAPSPTGTEQPSAEVRPFPVHRRRLVFALGAIAAVIIVMIALPTLLRRETAPPPIASFDATITTTLWRVGVDGDELLADGERIRPGDRIYMTVATTGPVHLYLINRDDTGEASVLFPIEGAQWSNPLQPGAVRRIPGDTTWDYDSWEVSSAGGRDAFIIVAAREPLPRMQSALDQLAAATPLDPGEYLRGGRGGSPDDPPDGAAGQSALDDLLRDLEASFQSGGEDLVLRRIVLENPR